jgi:NAD(P)-dependent dehydrogenase (short-subunit alcohol dehydrogenase family)
MFGAINYTFEFLPILLRKKGSTVVNIASAAVNSPPKGFSTYAAAKSALVSFSKSLGAEYGERGLRVLTISPGFMLTPATSAWHPMLREAITRSQNGPLDLNNVAANITDIVHDTNLPARGEEYIITNTY